MWNQIFDLADKSIGILDHLGVSAASLHKEELLAAARKEADLEDFGDESFLKGFDILLQAYQDEANLSPLGKVVTYADTLRLLTNRLKIVHEQKEHSGFQHEPIEKPIFILGLPRCGTTFMHRLLAEDPANRVPFSWEVMMPTRDQGSKEKRIKETDSKLNWFGRLAPEYKKIHRTGATHPQECIAILSYSFQSIRFHRTHHVPTYWNWLLKADNSLAYKEHKDFLKMLQHNGRFDSKRWILKTPSHLFFVDAILKEYPDARFIQTHRNPLTALSSNLSQVALLRKTFSAKAIEPKADHVAGNWSNALNRFTAIRKTLDPGRVLDVYYHDLSKDPVGEIARIYRYFGFELSDVLQARMQAFSNEHRKGKFGKHQYQQQQKLFNNASHLEAFRPYMDAHGIDAK
ncbi:MAG TPA: sulfotransferase [Cyclobacteriaceae bacterium]